MTGKLMKKETFIDFALYILFEPNDNERARLDNAWKAALQAADPARAVRIFAKKEGFSFTTAECQDALAFWEKFMEFNPDCLKAQGTGPVMY